jgi:pimeloyl-ACP methyl ester carboxylesterase
MLGHSMGGYVTLAFASKYPGKLRGIGLLHSHAMEDTPEAKVNRNRAIEVVNSDRGAFIFNFFPELFAPENVERYQKEIRKLHEDALDTSPKAIVAALEGMKYRTDKLDVLVKSKVPVLFVLGKQDSRIPFEKTLAQAALPATSEILVLDKVGHMGHIEARKKTLKAIEGFVKKSF